MKQTNLKRSHLAATISMILGVGAMAPSFAQEAQEGDAVNAAPEVEVVEVRGIRGSLLRAKDIKRGAQGVVDAISAEEIGKFPDTNLAESLQRIPGLTISRSNGEGSQVTARGFGPEFNLILLNGRQMPGTGNSRSFALENLSSEGVSALEVIKTARAEVPTGGIGATIDIQTAKPLKSPGLKYAVSAKGMYDESTVEGTRITPEIAGIYSNTFADNTIGVAISLSHQQRNFQQQGAAIDGWKANVTLPSDLDEANVVDPRAVDEEGNRIGNSFFPQNLGYSIADVQRERTNGQLTLQYAPTDALTMTLDYTASEAETGTNSTSFGVWFNAGGNIASYELDDNGTAVRFNELNNDFAHTVRKGTTRVELESLGFNLDYHLTDNWHIALDVHESSNKFDDGADSGSGNNGFVIMGPNNLLSKTYDFTSGEIPQIELFWPDGEPEALREDFDSQFGQFFHAPGESEITQAQLDVTWETDYDLLTRVKFGATYSDQSIGGIFGFSGNQGVVGYDGVQAVFPDSLFTRNDTGSFLDEFTGGGSDLTTNYYYTYDYDEVVQRHIAYYGDAFQADAFADGIDSETNVQEETLSMYVQADFAFEIFEMPADFNVGVRYEETDVTSTVRQNVEDQVVWSSSTEWVLTYQQGLADTFVVTEGQHDVLLPLMDFKLEITEDLVGRMSWGKTITRAPLGNLAGIRTLSANPKPGQRTGGSGNTNLQPFEATNFDLSFEYYYGESNFASIGYFQKDVKNFIISQSNEITVDGLNDIIGGPRYNQAISDIEGRGDTATVEAIFAQIQLNEGLGPNDPIVQSDDDPALVWLVTQPVNGETKKVDGIEVQLQHVFGESGFGIGANATFVDGDVNFDINSLVPQNPLPGLGDSANFQVFYEKDALAVKLTYAWRDTYLLGVGQAAGTSDAPPQFFREFGQWDVTASYDIDENLSVFFEGINLTNETEEIFGRYEEQFLSARQYGTRYLLGARYVF